MCNRTYHMFSLKWKTGKTKQLMTLKNIFHVCLCKFNAVQTLIITLIVSATVVEKHSIKFRRFKYFN